MSKLFENLKTSRGCLSRQPRKKEVLENVQIMDAKTVTILPDSNNRALIINTEKCIYLQSYDTLILVINKYENTLTKLYSGWSATTQKHINSFLEKQDIDVHFNKKMWEQFEVMDI